MRVNTLRFLDYWVGRLLCVVLALPAIRALKKNTVIGDSVNYASRIETCNIKLGTRFLISEEVYAAV